MQVSSSDSSSGSSYTSAAYSSNGISGMNSGMDTEALVKSMLSDIQTKIDKQEQKQKVLEMQQEEYRSVIDQINEFKDKYFSVTGEKSLVLSSTFKSSNTESSSAAVKAVSTSEAVEGSFDITVSQLATEAKVTGSKAASSGKSVKVGTELTGKAASTMKISVGSDEAEVDISGAVSSQDVVDKINKSCSKIGVTASLDSDGKIVYSGSGTASKITVDGKDITLDAKEASVTVGKIDTSNIGDKDDDGNVTNGTKTYKFKVNDTEYSVSLTRDQTSADVAKAINAAADKDGKTLSASGVTASVDDDGNLTFKPADGTEKISFEVVADSDTEDKTTGTLSDLGLSSQSATRTYTGTSAEKTEVNVKGKLTVSYNGVSKDISITDTETSDSLKQKLYDSFGSGIKLNSDGTITAGTGKNISVSGSDDVLTALGMDKKNTSNQISASQTLSEIYGDNGGSDYKFNINGVDFSFSADTKLSDMMTEINDSRAGVTMTYNSLNDKFSITGQEMGADSAIKVTDGSGSLLANMFGDAALKELTDGVTGKDAIVNIDGEEITYSGNDIKYNGINLTLKKVTSDPVNIETSRDTDKALDTIVSFVEDYNKLIADLNEKTHAKAEYKSYAPLTDAQKDEMTDDEIKKWEEKSKTGLLSGDSDISKFLSEMRSVLYTKVGDTKLLSDIGISSSSDWKDYGKLTVDKDKLTDALKNDMKGVSDIFTGSNGVCNRLSEACKKVANTSSGSPGSLVSLAGLKGKATETNNTITKRMDSIKEVITKLKAQYDSRKERLWKQFNTMETSLGSMNSTYNYLTSMMTG